MMYLVLILINFGCICADLQNNNNNQNSKKIVMTNSFMSFGAQIRTTDEIGNDEDAKAMKRALKEQRKKNAHK